MPSVACATSYAHTFFVHLSTHTHYYMCRVAAAAAVAALVEGIASAECLTSATEITVNMLNGTTDGRLFFVLTTTVIHLLTWNCMLTDEHVFGA